MGTLTRNELMLRLEIIILLMLRLQRILSFSIELSFASALAVY